jgi:hypothetical protein
VATGVSADRTHDKNMSEIRFTADILEDVDCQRHRTDAPQLQVSSKGCRRALACCFST